MVYLYALVVMFTSNIENTTIQYFPTIGECQVARNKLEAKLDVKNYKMNCIVIKVPSER